MAGRTARGLRRSADLLFVSLPSGMAAMVALPLLGVTALTTIIAGLGLVLFPLALEVVRRWADWERRRSGALLGVDVPPSPVVRAPGPTTGARGVAGSFERVLSSHLGAEWTLARIRRLLTDRATWRAVRWLLVHLVVGTATGLVGLTAILGVPATIVQTFAWSSIRGVTLLGVTPPNWPVALLLGGIQTAVCVWLLCWGAPWLAHRQALMTLRLLSPSAAELRAEELAARVDVLTETRAGAVDAHDAELRRIERDLHDGTQARLVSIAMRLGVAEQTLKDDPEVAKLVQEARVGAEEAMQELREVIRTMYPPILSDRGLDGALAALVARCPVPTTLDVGDLGQLPTPVEAAAYFVVAEALTNVAKHSAATEADVRASRYGDRLVVEVRDNGIGGIDESRGTGVAGIRRRVGAIDGASHIESPAGGPSSLLVELPCGS
ncbi:sensor histidine kinase [Actinopolymorpha pittospori]|uniref:histidine kinase n=1 Tax=Actinopolymorpha pittospori TaxID=648752 RepID=A0A927REX9_9ACTN|nr:sensor histidine kinase [Actinopolymorpha pittospori]MBE1612709.1 signal transduction histidine kinase [Actinopolymorpha pittospori]